MARNSILENAGLEESVMAGGVKGTIVENVGTKFYAIFYGNDHIADVEKSFSSSSLYFSVYLVYVGQKYMVQINRQKFY